MSTNDPDGIVAAARSARDAEKEFERALHDAIRETRALLPWRHRIAIRLGKIARSERAYRALWDIIWFGMGFGVARVLFGV